MTTGDALDAVLLRLALAKVVRAPSSHNSQPWSFHVVGDTVELRADPSRRLPVVDPNDRELIISCGAALDHLRVVLRGHGVEPVVELLDDGERLARVRFGQRFAPTADDEAVMAAIDRRHTNRAPFEKRPVPLEAILALREAAGDQHAFLLAIQEPERRHALAALIADGDRRQWHDAEFRRELAHWMRPNQELAFDGMPGRAVGVASNLVSYVAPLVVRTFDRGDGEAARDRELAEGAPLLAVLGTAHDQRRDWLHAGEALSRVLLRATTLGLSASFLNQPIEVSALRDDVRKLAGVDGAPQLILRIGYGTTVPATPRRPVEDVLR